MKVDPASFKAPLISPEQAWKEAEGIRQLLLTATSRTRQHPIALA